MSVFSMSRAPFKAQRLRRLRVEWEGRLAATSQYQSIYKRSPLCALNPSPRSLPLPPANHRDLMHVRTSVRLGRVSHLSRSIARPRSVAAYRRNRIGAHATILKANPSHSDMQRDAKGGSSVTSRRRTRMLLFTTAGRVGGGMGRTGRVRLPSVNHARRSERGGRDGRRAAQLAT